MTDSSDLIKPGEIPGKDINVELITLAAQNLRTAAIRVRDRGAATVTNWSKLSGSYEAPDAEQLFGVMVPVGTTTTTFGDHLDIATGALETFAEEIAPIKAELDRLRAEAWKFTGEVSGGVEVPVVYATRGGVIETGKTQEKEWHEDDATVDKNNQLRIDVNTQVELMWAAERKAANTIRALYCAVPLVAGDGSDAANMYMYDEIPDDAEVPWGHPVERTEGCGEAAVTFVFEDFLWKGIVVGGIWGTIEGLGGLISYNSQTGQWGDWEFAGQAWKQLGQLAYAITVPTAIQQAAATQDNAFGEWNRESQETVVNTLKGIVAWDQWAENPGAAAGTTVFNVGTIFIPAGAAVTSIKSGALASKLATAARVMDYLDASSLALKAGTGAFRFTSTGLGQLSNLLDGLKVADNVDSQIPSVNNSTISVGDTAVSGADEAIPPVREDVQVDVPVREPVEVGGGSGGGSGHPGTGGGSSGLPEGPGGSPLDDGPTGGSHGDGSSAGDDAPAGVGDDAPTNDGPTNNDGPSSHDGDGGTGNTPENPGAGSTGSGTALPDQHTVRDVPPVAGDTDGGAGAWVDKTYQTPQPWMLAQEAETGVPLIRNPDGSVTILEYQIVDPNFGRMDFDGHVFENPPGQWVYPEIKANYDFMIRPLLEMDATDILRADPADFSGPARGGVESIQNIVATAAKRDAYFAAMEPDAVYRIVVTKGEAFAQLLRDALDASNLAHVEVVYVGGAK